MEARDFIIIALVGVGGWLWYRSRQQPQTGFQTTQAKPAPNGPGSITSQMTNSAALLTIFGGKPLTRGVVATSGDNPWVGTPPTAPGPAFANGSLYKQALSKALNAYSAPALQSPTPNTRMQSSAGVPASPGFAPPEQSGTNPTRGVIA